MIWPEQANSLPQKVNYLSDLSIPEPPLPVGVCQPLEQVREPTVNELKDKEQPILDLPIFKKIPGSIQFSIKVRDQCFLSESKAFFL